MDFLTLKHTAFGLDISDSSIKFAKLKRKRGGNLSLESYGEFELDSGIVEAGDIKNSDALIQVLGRVAAKIKGSKYVVCSLPEEKAFLQVIQMPKMTPKELEKAVLFEAENYIPLPTEKMYLDFQQVSPLADNLDHTDVLLVAFPKAVVDAYVSCLHRAGFQPIVLETESLATSRAIVPDGKSNNLILILDLGEARTVFMIFSGFSLRLAVSIPVSGRQLTSAISRELKIDLKKAEELKIEYGLSARHPTKLGEGFRGHEIVRRVFDALVPALTSLTEEVKKYLDYYQSHERHEHFGPDKKSIELVLCGGGANLRGLDSFLASELRVKVTLGNPWVNILPKPLKEVPGLKYEDSLRYTTALGLALRGLV